MSPSEQLYKKYNKINVEAASTKLTNELCDGTLPDHKLFTYLVQDLKYFTIGLRLFAKAVTLCDIRPSMLVLGKQLGFVCADENDYFDTCLDLLKKSPEVVETIPNMLKYEPVLPEVSEYIKYMEYLVEESTSYIEVITALYIMEKVYWDWAELNVSGGNVPADLPYKYKEWINLHHGPAFEKWVGFLQGELDRTFESDPEICEVTWRKTVGLEIGFFDACYNYSEK